MRDEHKITEREYREEIDELAEEYNLIRHGKTDKTEPDDPQHILRETADRWLHEMIDGHQWVIYDKYHYQVLQHSPNDEAIDELGIAQDDTRWSKKVQMATYCAIERNVQERAIELRKG